MSSTRPHSRSNVRFVTFFAFCNWFRHCSHTRFSNSTPTSDSSSKIGDEVDCRYWALNFAFLVAGRFPQTSHRPGAERRCIMSIIEPAPETLLLPILSYTETKSRSLGLSVPLIESAHRFPLQCGFSSLPRLIELGSNGELFEPSKRFKNNTPPTLRLSACLNSSGRW